MDIHFIHVRSKHDDALPLIVGIHTNMPGAVPAEINDAALIGAPPPPGLSAEERHAYDQLVFFHTRGLAYALEMGNRPQTLYGIADSPVGLAAWIIDHDARSLELIARVHGQEEGLTRDDVLDNITLYWLTNTAIASVTDRKSQVRSDRRRSQPTTTAAYSSIEEAASHRDNQRRGCAGQGVGGPAKRGEGPATVPPSK